MTMSGVSPTAVTGDMPRASRTEFAFWHTLILAAGLTLATSFLLPAWDIGRGDPAHLLRVELYNWWHAPDMPATQLFFLFSCFAACPLLGLIMAADSAAQLAGCRRLAHAFSGLPAILLILIGAGLLWTAAAAHGERFRAGETWSLPGTLIAGSGTLAYVLWASRLGSRAVCCYGFGACMAAVSYLSFLSWSGLVAYGTYVSVAAGGLLLVGAVGTARTSSHESWWGTVWQLMTCQLEDRSVTSVHPAARVSAESDGEHADRPLPLSLESPVP